MADVVELTVNGARHRVQVQGDTPLLYVLRNDLALNGAKFGCGLAQCGACTVLVDGEAMRSCVTPDRSLGECRDHHDRGARHARQAASAAAGLHRRAGGAVRLLHQRHDHDGEGAARPQAAAERSARCATALAGNLCRCGTHNRIVARRAARGERRGGPDMNAPILTRRDFGQAAGRHRRSPSASTPAELLRAGRRASCPAASTPTACSMPGCASTPTAPPPSSPARSSSARAS